MPSLSLRKISELAPGEQFIWADKYTRDIMLCRPPFDYRSSICTFHEHSGTMDFHFSENSTGMKYWYSYGDNCRVYVVSGLGHNDPTIGYDLMCARCNKRYGDHQGLRCPGTYSERKVFVPDQMSAMPSEDWLKAELGL